jgi:sulfotransferase
MDLYELLELIMHVIAGLPRSGSTLLCNILNQNPAFHASSTSILPTLVGQSVKTWSDSPEMKGELHRNAEATRVKLAKALRGFCEGWYHQQLAEGRTIFDKGRGWAANAMLLREVFPDSKIILCVRDLREVFASVERQHQKVPTLDGSENPLAKTVWERQHQLFSPGGLIGQQILSLLDIVRRRLDALHVRYEAFVEQPKKTMLQIYEYLGIDPFEEHDFDDVKNTAMDVDALYLNKFPHKGEGKVQPATGSWKDVFTADVAEAIMQRYPLFNDVFGYR